MKREMFPSDFLWGVATASYQIEGAYNEDGKGESIWDRFAHTPGKIKDGTTGDVACDHYHRYREDIALLKELGVNAYRFSVSWPRIFPCGKGEVNQKGLDFYNALVDELLKQGIKPLLTLYHWDLPQPLQFHGGWTNTDTVQAFLEYAMLLFKTLGDRVELWATFNEPWCISFLSHELGEHAPGIKDRRTALQVAHNVLVAHGKAVKAFRGENLPGKIGIVLNLYPVHPLSESEQDKEAATLSDCYRNRWFLDPVFKGKYPEELLSVYQKLYGDFAKDYESIQVASEKMDFLGVNYYSREVVSYDPKSILKSKTVKVEGKRTDMDWEIYPQGIQEILVRINREYGPIDLYVTENGAAFKDEMKNGEIQDYERIDFLKEHFKNTYYAIQQGVPVKGYFVWSLMDNFEWAHGYSKRFGLFYVDYNDNLKRIPKESARWFKKFLNNEISLEE